MSDEKTSEDEKKDAAEDFPEPRPVPVKAVAESKGSATDTEEEGDEEEASPIDSASPEAIARRVAALGDEDKEEAKSREEERKLAERRAGANTKKKGIKKSGLEVSASKKLAKIGTRAEPKRTIAVASDADPLIERTTKISEWAKQNQRAVMIAVGVAAVALLGFAGFNYHEHKQESDASALLTKAVDDERAKVGEPPKEDPESQADAPLMFKTYPERTDSALTKFREVESKYPKTGAAILSRLAEGSLLLDKQKPDEALAAFGDVKGSALATADQEVKLRAVEGIGFAHELKAAAAGPGGSAKEYDDALAAYKEMENTDVRGFKELAMYHQARVLENKGEKEKAKEVLVALKTRLDTPDDRTLGTPPAPPFPYLKEVAMDRLRAIDPAAAPKTPPPGARPPGGRPGAGAPGGKGGLDTAALQKMIEEAQRKAGQNGGMPPAPPAPKSSH